MQCPICKAEVPPPPSICPRCGWFNSVIPASTATEVNKLAIILPIVLVIIMVALAATGIYLIRKSGALNRIANSQRSPRHTEFKVVHGKVVTSGDLHGNGQLYFVPIGKQAIQAQSFADYYKQKFNLQITVLPSVPLALSARSSERKQCISEEMILAMKRAYPKIAGNPSSVMIALTDEDMYARSLDWNFTYAYHADLRFAVVSTRRMDPTFWGTPPDEKWRLAASKQMLTAYIAFLYFRVPRSYDPSSVMYQPFTPDGAADNLYESDIHSEASANGRRGEGWPCLTFTYSHSTHQLTPWPRFLNDCYESANPSSTEEETFQVELAHGQFVQRSLDLHLESVPAIELRRSYLSQYTEPMAFGLGSNDNYNSWLLSDGPSKLSFIDIIHEDGERNHLKRVSKGVGFSSSVVFEDRNDPEELYGARMTWDSDHFKMTARDGSWWTYLPCINDSRCFWVGYQDGSGHALTFQRDSHLALERLTTSDGQAVQFASDSKFRIVEAKDSKGSRISYEYDSAGCLSRIGRADEIETYSYDTAHRMTAVSVTPRAGKPQPILSVEYNSVGQASSIILANGATYNLHYSTSDKTRVPNVKVTDPSGKIFDINISNDTYVAKTTPVLYPATGKFPAPH